ncbi:hypothetical protein BX600DRAFT_443102 [Xylariales sp. PMI_506]|nr:hypothetical protein BX600DRAFT_443102 [Xylariales sp. PMI_506]
MKTAVFFTTTLAALASTVSAATCVVQNNAVKTYIVTASGLGDVPGTCGGLWDNLKRFADCAGVSNPECDDGGTQGNLFWRFTVSTFCNAGMVESTWWEATQNDYGSISC